MIRFLPTTQFLVVLLFAFSFSCSHGHAQDSGNRLGGLSDSLDKYVTMIIKRYDENSDGILQSDEMKSMRRSPKDADLDGDGSATKEELLEYYAQWTKKSNDRKRSRSSRIPRGGASGGARQDKDKRTNMIGSTAIVAKKENTEDSEDDKSESEADSIDETVSINVFMFRGEDSEKVSKLGRLLKGETHKVVDRLLREYAKTLGSNYDLDSLEFDVAWQQKFSLTVGSTVPVVKSVSRGRGTTQSSTSNYEVGTKLEMGVFKEGDVQFMNVEIVKSAVFESDIVLFKSESGKETLAKQVSDVEAQHTIPFKMDKANVISMSDSGSSWLLVFVAW